MDLCEYSTHVLPGYVNPGTAVETCRGKRTMAVTAEARKSALVSSWLMCKMVGMRSSLACRAARRYLTPIPIARARQAVAMAELALCRIA